MVFHWILSDSNSPKVSRTLLGILADLINTVVWVVSTCPLITKSSSPFTNSFGDRSKCTNYNWYNRHFHAIYFFSYLGRSRYLSLFSLYFSLFCGLPGQQSPQFSRFSFFFLLFFLFFFFFFWLSLCVHMIKFKFLARFPVNRFSNPVMLRFILLCTNLLHSLIMWLIVSTLSPTFAS